MGDLTGAVPRKFVSSNVSAANYHLLLSGKHKHSIGSFSRLVSLQYGQTQCKSTLRVKVNLSLKTTTWSRTVFVWTWPCSVSTPGFWWEHPRAVPCVNMTMFYAMFCFYSRVLVGAPKEKIALSGGANETGDAFFCPISVNRNDCGRMNLVTSGNGMSVNHQINQSICQSVHQLVSHVITNKSSCR